MGWWKAVRMSKGVKRAVVLVSCASLLAASSGCTVSSAYRAEAARGKVSAEMTREEVQERLGDPTLVVAPVPPPAVEAWVYRYHSSTDVAGTILAIIIVAVLVVAVACAGSGGGVNFGGGGGGGGGPPSEFVVFFGADGRVMTVTPIAPVPAP